MGKRKGKPGAKTSSKQVAETASKSSSQPMLKVAAPLSAIVQIRNVVLLESRIERGTDAPPDLAKVTRTLSVTSVRHKKYPDISSIKIKISFLFSITPIPEGHGETILSIEATFLLTYAVPELDLIDDKAIDAFSETNGVYNAWPYWREYIQSTASRMGLPQTVIPVFRL